MKMIAIFNLIKGAVSMIIISLLLVACNSTKDSKVTNPVLTVGQGQLSSFADKVPASSYVLIPGSAHMTSLDAKEENLKVVRDFLNSVDSLRIKKILLTQES